ncbi:MAG TPA: hypothetical protein VI916_14965 [Acidimicrobiia bacterium]|nr:hypothetical protein [Acidimicrobiia bacterium]
MAASWRIVDDLDVVQTGAERMATDLALLADVARGGRPALRFYTWDPPALSLGRFQPADDVDEDACRARGVDVVRRPTGGRALLHGGDLTYAVAVPRPKGEAGSVAALYNTLAEGLITGLRTLGVCAQVAHHAGETSAACFASLRGSDLRVNDRKLVGSAQVHKEHAVLQHGSVLRTRLAFDECDLLRFDEEARRREARARLRASTITLEELGVDVDVSALAMALTRGFATSLDLDLQWSERSRAFVAARQARQ